MTMSASINALHCRAARCVLCHKATRDSELLRLWDARVYCRSCVASRSRDLLLRAESNAELTDHVSIRQIVSLKDLALTVGFGIVVCLAVAWIVPELAGVLVVPLCVLATVVLPVIVLGQAIVFPQTITIADGVVTISSPVLTSTLPFERCEWDVNGWLIPGLIVTRYRPAIYLYARLSWQGWRFDYVQSSFTLCLDTQDRAIWEAFLRLTFDADDSLRQMSESKLPFTPGAARRRTTSATFPK